jgi:hypothetical protein
MRWTALGLCMLTTLQLGQALAQAPTTAPAAKPAVTPPQQAAQDAKPVPTSELHKPAAVLGTDVMTSDGTDIGRIVNVLVDAQGQPKAAVINVGGFLGVGTRTVAVAWQHLQFKPGASDKATLDLSADDVRKAPEYEGSDEAVKVVGPLPPSQVPPTLAASPAGAAPQASTAKPAPPAPPAPATPTPAPPAPVLPAPVMPTPVMPTPAMPAPAPGH